MVPPTLVIFGEFIKKFFNQNYEKRKYFIVSEFFFFKYFFKEYAGPNMTNFQFHTKQSFTNRKEIRIDKNLFYFISGQ